MPGSSFNFRGIVRDLSVRKVRSALSVLGIVIGVAGVIVIVSLGAGAQALVLGQLTKLGTNLVGILPGKSSETGPPAAVFGVQVTTLSELDLESIRDRRRFPEVIDAAPFARGNVTVSVGGRSVDTMLTATTSAYARIQEIHQMARGVFWGYEEDQSSANVIVLGHDVAEELFPSGGELGAVLKVQKSGDTLAGVPFRVIGIQRELGTVAFQNQDDQVLVPFKVGQRQVLGIDHIQFIRAKIDSPENVKAAIVGIEQVLRENHRITNPDDDDFSVRDLADALQILTNITDGLRLFLALMAGVALLVGGIGIMNIMLATVSERTREIGLRKALGATGGDIRRQFISEAAALTGMGGVLGILFGSALSYVIAIGARSAGYDWAFVISPLGVLLALLVSVLTGITFGFFPARKAAKMDPIEALRHE